MCLAQGDSASPCASPRIAPDSGPGCMARAVLMSARSATPYPLTLRLVTSIPRSKCWSTSAERSFSLPAINRQLPKVIDRTVEQ